MEKRALDLLESSLRVFWKDFFDEFQSGSREFTTGEEFSAKFEVRDYSVDRQNSSLGTHEVLDEGMQDAEESSQTVPAERVRNQPLRTDTKPTGDESGESLLWSGFSAFFKRVAAYCNMVLRFNPSYALVNISSEEELVSRHILDSLAPAKLIFKRIFGNRGMFGGGAGLYGKTFSSSESGDREPSEGALKLSAETFSHALSDLCNEKGEIQNRKNNTCVLHLADLGSGAGLPGVVLAIFLDSILSGSKYVSCGVDLKDFWKMHLVERMGRRAGFLRTVTASLGLLKNVSVEERDLSGLQTTFDIVTFRAFRRLSDIGRDLLRITREGSRVFIYKATMSDIEDDIAEMSPDTRRSFDFETLSYDSLPGMNVEFSPGKASAMEHFLLALKRRGTEK